MGPKSGTMTAKSALNAVMGPKFGTMTAPAMAVNAKNQPFRLAFLLERDTRLELATFGLGSQDIERHNLLIYNILVFVKKPFASFLQVTREGSQ